MDWPMLYTGNPYVIQPGNVFFMHMILMDSDNELAMNLGETYLVTETGNERLGKKKLDLVVLQVARFKSGIKSQKIPTVRLLPHSKWAFIVVPIRFSSFNLFQETDSLFP